MKALFLKSFTQKSAYFFSPNLNLIALKKAKTVRQKEHIELMMPTNQAQIKELSVEEKKNEYLTQYIFPNQENNFRIFEYKNKILDNQNVSYPHNAWYKILFPFKSNSDIRDKVQRFNSDHIRVGKLLEILDMTAGTVAYNYCYNKFDETTIVTACIDNVHFFNQVNIFKDLEITAYPTFAGTSTIEIQFDLCQEQELIAEAKFLMVARNSKNYAKKYIVPKLQLEGDDVNSIIKRYNIGKLNQETRIKQSSISLKKIPPNPQEVLLIHDFFLNRDKYKQNHEKFVDIEHTKLEKAVLMHKQDRNIHGKIFGGYLIRESIEIGWLNAKLFSNYEIPLIFDIDDCQFLQPVEVGSAMNFKSRVACVDKNLIQTIVECEKIINETQRQKTLELHLTFIIPDKDNLRNVYPKTYKDAIYHLEAKRKMKNLENK